jgi:hypothetical protein
MVGAFLSEVSMRACVHMCGTLRQQGASKVCGAFDGRMACVLYALRSAHCATYRIPSYNGLQGFREGRGT